MGNWVRERKRGKRGVGGGGRMGGEGGRETRQHGRAEGGVSLCANGHLKRLPAATVPGNGRNDRNHNKEKPAPDRLNK